MSRVKKSVWRVFGCPDPKLNNREKSLQNQKIKVSEKELVKK